MNNDELIARSEAALEGVTEGPWKLRLYQSGTVQVMIREWADGSPDTRQGGSTYGYHSAYMSMHNIGTRDDAETDNEKYRNGKFIAESRDLVPALIAALKASEARVKELEEALIDHNDLLRSAFQIADREGVKMLVATTNWDAFYNKVAITLKRHHQITNEVRAVLKGGAE
jgi:hypothetical protein